MHDSRITPDSPTAHDAPPLISEDRQRSVFTGSRDAPEHGGLVADERELAKYLDALLDRERATALSVYGLSYRALERGDIDIYAHAATTQTVIPEPRIVVDAIGRSHLAPEWRKFDPGLAREIRYQIRAIENSRRFPAASTQQLPFDGIPARGERPAPVMVPTPQYRGAKAGRKIVGAGRPVSAVRPTFYLPRQSELSDVLSESSSRNTRGGSDRVSDEQQWEAVALCLEVTRAVTLRIVGTDALAEILIRLNAPLSVEETVFGMLGHRDRKRLRKALQR